MNVIETDGLGKRYIAAGIAALGAIFSTAMQHNLAASLARVPALAGSAPRIVTLVAVLLIRPPRQPAPLAPSAAAQQQDEARIWPPLTDRRSPGRPGSRGSARTPRIRRPGRSRAGHGSR